MDIREATVLFFSGTGTTKKYARAFAAGLPYRARLTEIRHDIPLTREYASDELLVFACPVFAGYVPPFVWERLAGVSGTNTPTVVLAVYGARDYDNALIEMSEKLAEKGFRTVGAAALVARHSIVQTIAPDRPNATDVDEASAFAKTVARRLESLTTATDAPVFAFKGQVGTGDPSKGPDVLVNDACVRCGICVVECPVRAIPVSAPNTTDADACISCLRCIEACPVDARFVPEVALEASAARLAPIVDPSKPNEFF